MARDAKVYLRFGPPLKKVGDPWSRISLTRYLWYQYISLFCDKIVAQSQYYQRLKSVRAISEHAPFKFMFHHDDLSQFSNTKNAFYKCVLFLISKTPLLKHIRAATVIAFELLVINEYFIILLLCCTNIVVQPLFSPYYCVVTEFLMLFSMCIMWR